MSKSLQKLMVVFSICIPSLMFGYEVHAWGRTYDYSCGYFSRRASDLSFTYGDTTLPYGTEVNAIVGFKGQLMLGGRHKELSWEDRVVVPAKAINVSTWEAKLINKTLHHRTEGRFLSNAQFVFEVKVPGQAPRYVNGGSTWGYFETSRLDSMVECIRREGEFPAWRSLDISTIVKESSQFVY